MEYKPKTEERKQEIRDKAREDRYNTCKQIIGVARMLTALGYGDVQFTKPDKEV